MIDISEMKNSFEKSLSFSDDKARDLSFAVKCFLLNEDYAAANEYLKPMIDSIKDLKNIISYGLVLTAICDGIREIEDIDTNIVEELTIKLENNVRGTAPHWLYGGQADYYLSNIAIVYGAIRSALTIIDNDTARKYMVSLRDYTFKNLLQKGHLISSAEENTRFGDLPVCAFPFRMFEAEDRVLVESMEEEPERFFDSSAGIGFKAGSERNKELTLLLAWYFAEKGDIEKGDLLRAKAFYNTAAKLAPSEGKEAFGIILSAIVEQVLNKKENQNGRLKVIHIPLGTSDPYYVSLHERTPRIPIEDEDIIINAEVSPAFGEYNVQLEYSRNNLPLSKAEMKKQSSDVGALYYSANMESFKYADEVSYKIIAEGEEKNAVSESFTFKTAKWFDNGAIVGARQIAEGIEVYFEKNEQSGIVPVLLIRPSRKTASLEFAFQKTSAADNILSFQTFKVEDFEIKIVQNGIYVYEKNSNNVKVSLEGAIISFLYNGDEIISSRLNLAANEGEKYFGMGERYSCIEYRGLRIDNYVYNQYRSQGLKTYMPSPFYISTAGYGLYLNTDAYSIFDFCCTDSCFVTAEGYCKDGGYKLDLFIGSTKEIVSSYIARTGLPELPPMWAFGPWMSSNNWDSQKEVLHQLEMTQKHNIPATVLVIEQWSDEATFYIFNDAKYKVQEGKERFRADDFEFAQWGRWPDPKSMVEKLHQEGIKVLLWQIPFHKYMGGVQHPQRDMDEEVMVEKGYCIKNDDGTPYRIPYGWFTGSVVLDFTNPEARRWWLGKRRYLLEDIGIDGFKTDGGEGILGDDLKFFDGTSGREMHNRYVLDYIGAYNSYVKEMKGEGITFSRAGYTGAQKMPMHWAGDERSTWEAFRSSIRAGISAGLSGIIFWGWDLAGFHGEIPTVELYIRSAEMAALCPVMQYHAETKGEFCLDRTPWNMADRTGDIRAITLYSRYAKLRMNLLPYIYSEAVKCVRNNEPLMRAMVYDFPDESESIKLDMQYMFGRSILVAPVVEEGKTTNRVYIPRGKWYGLFDNTVYEKPGYYDIDAPIDSIPAFVRGNSIIPLNLNSSLELFSDVGNNVECFENLCLDIRLEDSVSGTFDFGAAGQVKIAVNRVAGGIKVEAAADQPIILRFWNEEKPQGILMDKQACAEHSITYLEKQIIIKVEAGAHEINIAAK